MQNKNPKASAPPSVELRNDGIAGIGADATCTSISAPVAPHTAAPPLEQVAGEIITL